MGDERRKLVTGRLGRVARLARAGASTGLAALRSGDATPGATKAAKLLGELRGVATKVGQMAGYVDGLVPQQHRAAFDKSMAGLRAAAPRSDSAQIRQTIEAEFGKPVQALFAAWDDTPIASASIGQVHRARLANGREVAVKVQHPGIREAMGNDLRNAGLLRTAAGAMGLGRFGVGQFIEEAKARFGEELDYDLEARRLKRFAALHRDDPRIIVPDVISELSGASVLTTEFVDAMPFEAAMQVAVPTRRQYAETLWTFAYRSIMCGGVFNADPHPGNYLFKADGRVVFLDFGCVQEVDPFHRRQIVTAHRALGFGDFDGCMAAMAPVLRAKPGTHTEIMTDYLALALRPISESPFRITQEFAASVVDRFKAMAVTVRKLGRSDFEHLPSGLLFLMRLQFGFYSVLARLDVDVDYRAVEAAFMERAWAAVQAESATDA